MLGTEVQVGVLQKGCCRTLWCRSLVMQKGCCRTLWCRSLVMQKGWCRTLWCRPVMLDKTLKRRSVVLQEDGAGRYSPAERVLQDTFVQVGGTPERMLQVTLVQVAGAAGSWCKTSRCRSAVQ